MSSSMKRSCTASRSAARMPRVVGGRAQVVPAQRRGELLGRAAGGDVDDAGRLRRRDVLAQGAALALGVLEALDGEPDVGPVEAAHQHRRLAQAEPLGDLVPHGRRGGRGQGEDGGRPSASAAAPSRR